MSAHTISADAALHRDEADLGHLPYWVRKYRVLERRGLSPTAAILLAIAGGAGYLQVCPNEFLVMLVFGTTMVEFVRRMDQGIPLLQITALLAVLQWLVGPSITYFTNVAHGRYFMYVVESYYFQFALPATAAYCIALLMLGSSPRQKLLIQAMDRRQFVRIGFILAAIGVACFYAAGKAPGGLQFALFLASQLRYVGALYFLFSYHRYRYLFAIACCSQLFITSSESGMFHDLIIWLMMIFTFWFAQWKWRLDQKLLCITFAFLFVFVIQAIKQDYREKRMAGMEVTITGEVARLMSNSEPVLEGEILPLATARLNQGWIISAVLANVPFKEPYANGETVIEAIKSSALPRFLAPDKKMAGGQENFRRFTGLPIENGTSMGISPLGEAFANFGIHGGILFMGLFGAFFALFYNFVLLHVVKHPDFLFWVPLIFYQGIKAETELVVVMNQLVKGAVICFGGYWGLRHFVMPYYRPFLGTPAAVGGQPAESDATV
ncbi:hypothetical protein Poly24_32270 [Rosistilla carotiformis]|uniref:Uncharacterized protein n=1 Tax=Rosistilla carotiformis TaxID=2528017 RepID=A0A518JVD7_9BACT|nr:hypothetical protein [Rosistilla carotiformis]QDV69511.1 hypothetical protein Poly24_32270 [Rosistilla carotiformis]